LPLTRPAKLSPPLALQVYNKKKNSGAVMHVLVFSFSCKFFSRKNTTAQLCRKKNI
jgi:hypothetical protein